MVISVKRTSSITLKFITSSKTRRGEWVRRWYCPVPPGAQHNAIHETSRGIKGLVPTVAAAESIFLTLYYIWHRRPTATATSWRNLLSYFYWRITTPEQDLIVEQDFGFAPVDYGCPIGNLCEPFCSDINVASMFLWLCGTHDEFQNLAKQSWPQPAAWADAPQAFQRGLPPPAPVHFPSPRGIAGGRITSTSINTESMKEHTDDKSHANESE